MVILVVLGAGVEPGEHQLGELRPGDPGERLVVIDQALRDELGGDPERRGRGPLADAGLQHPQLAALDGELDVAQIAVVVLQRPHDVHELVVGRLVDLLEVLQRDRVADAGHHVLALRVLQVVAVHALLAGAGVAGEGDAGPRVHAQVAEHHRHHVDRGAEVGGNPLLPPVQDGPVGVPRLEHRADGQVHLLARLLREVPAGVLAHDALERLDQLAQVGGVEIQVVLRPLRPLGRLDRVLEGLAVDAEHRLAEHLDQAAVGVPGEPLVVGLLGQAVHRLVRQPDVQDGLHHARHGELRPGPDADQQRIRRVTELAAHGRFQRAQVGRDLVVQAVGHRALLQVVTAGIGRDREARAAPAGRGWSSRRGLRPFRPADPADLCCPQ